MVANSESGLHASPLVPFPTLALAENLCEVYLRRDYHYALESAQLHLSSTRSGFAPFDFGQFGPKIGVFLLKTLRKSSKSLAAPQACLHEPGNFRGST